MQPVTERAAQGKASRAEAARSSHAELAVSPERDPVALLEAQARARVPELVPIRYGRMLVSPWTFFRGAATVMAHDLAGTGSSGLRAQLCGDAHLANFGVFASAERSLVFDLNDFDETLAGLFEWDVKRLAASFEIAGRGRNFSQGDRTKAVRAAVRSYRETMRGFAAMRDLEVWYARMDPRATLEQLRASSGRKVEKKVRQLAAKAQTKDSARAFVKLTHEVDGKRRIVSDPPLIVPLSELVGDDTEPRVQAIFRRYLRSLPNDRRVLLERFRYADLAHKVVGVGSVGTRCWMMLLLGRDDGDPLFLQIKEAEASVLEPLLGPGRFRNSGRRVVEGQRLMQAASDIFLGWVRVDDIDGTSRDFYVRQLWDWKGSVDIATIPPRGLAPYAQACGWTLARAHARSGDRVAIAAYLGKGETFDRAVTEFAAAYADLNEGDHKSLADAAGTGRIVAAEGV